MEISWCYADIWPGKRNPQIQMHLRKKSQVIHFKVLDRFFSSKTALLHDYDNWQVWVYSIMIPVYALSFSTMGCLLQEEFALTELHVKKQGGKNQAQVKLVLKN